MKVTRLIAFTCVSELASLPASVDNVFFGLDAFTSTAKFCVSLTYQTALALILELVVLAGGYWLELIS